MPRTATAFARSLLLYIGVSLVSLFAPPDAARADGAVGVLDLQAEDPRGLYWDSGSDYLYFAETAADRVRRWKEGDAEPFVSVPSCGPTAIARADKNFVIACNTGGYLLVVDAHGKEVQRISKDADGRQLVSPNGLSGDGYGVYVTDSGAFSPTAPGTGVLYYWEPGNKLQELMTGFHYPDGVVLDRQRGRVLVSEHLGQQIISFGIDTPGNLDTNRISVFADIGASLSLESPYFGPSGLAVDESPVGTIYAAIYGDGTVQVFGRDGRPQGFYLMPMDRVTGVALEQPFGTRLFVSGVSGTEGDGSGFIVVATPDDLIAEPTEDEAD